MKIILPIKPLHYSHIIKSITSVIYRKYLIKENVQEILFYVTNPIKQILASAKICKVICDTPSNVFKNCSPWNWISEQEFNHYFANKQKAYAYVIKNIKLFKPPKQLIEYGVVWAPQLCAYVE